jgi:hypothetical protein
MKVRLISLTPTGYPNLALMKISAHHKAQGDEVSIDEPDPDKVYVSSPFSQYKDACDYSKMFPDAEIEYGGYGFSDKKLPDHIEHLLPDYSIFNCDHSMGFTCYDEHTEVLTLDGWKYFKCLGYSDKIATLNDSSGELEYQTPIEIVQEKYVGKLLHFKNLYIDLLVTPNHRMYVKKHSHISSYKRKDGTRKEGRFELIPAEEAAKYYNIIFKKDAIWNGVEQLTFKLPDIKTKNRIHKQYVYNMDDWLEFLGYYLSEGSATQKQKTRNYIVKISQNYQANLETYIKIENCIKRLKYSYYKNPKEGFYISNKQLYDFLKPLGHSHDKYVPTEFKQLSSRQLKIFFDAFIAGDGHVYTTKNGFKLSAAITSSKNLADDLQEIMLKMGCCGDISLHTKKGAGYLFKKENRMIYATGDIYRIATNSFYSNPIFSKQNREVHEVEHNGLVYCCIVPNHIIYIRRNGKAVWCGNTRGCIRNCWFCQVPKKEGQIRINSPVQEFHHPDHDTITLLDNNILYFNDWFMQNTDYILKEDLKVEIESGIDMRLVNEKNAERLKELKHAGLLHFAFDDLSYENEVRRGIEILEEAGFKPRYLMCYILAWPGGFEDAWKRLEIIWKEYRIDPFVQVYNNSRKDKNIRKLARWCNKPQLRKSCEFGEYRDRR